MENKAQTFRIFVSSTFSDLKAERNALQANVFPRLRELCATKGKGARFQPIDLRWGVSDEASLDQQAMNICLSEVDRCQKISPRPNFIVLLGNRYGWMPPPAQIPEKEYQDILTNVNGEDQSFLNEWYKKDTNAQPPERRLKPREKKRYGKYEDWQPVESRLQAILSKAVGDLALNKLRKMVYQASATHQEILTGALEEEDAPEHVFCFFRNIPDLPKSFSKAAYDEMLTARLALDPLGRKPVCQDLAEKVHNLPDTTTAKKLHDYLKAEISKVPERTDEEGVLKFMHQVLVDLTGKDFINLDENTWAVDQEAAQGLEQLKTDLRAKFSANLFEAAAVDWRGDGLPAKGQPYQMISEDHIGGLPADLEDCLPLLEEGYKPQNLCQAVFRALGRVILAEVDHPHAAPEAEEKVVHIQPRPTLDAEGLAHHAFAEERLTYFVGRGVILDEISAYLTGGDSHVLAVLGEGGTGKSALMAKAAERAQKANPNAQLVYRFIGATPGSSDGRSLLESLCKEISRCYGVDESDVPLDFRDLVPEFTKRLGLAKKEKPLILFIDSLDQLSEHQDARRLSWLPEKLPDGVSLVVSSRKEEDKEISTKIYPNLQGKKVIEKELGGLDEKDGRALLELWLGDKQVCRSLTTEQEGEVISKFIASKGNPLYLKLAFEEARLWTSLPQEQEKLTVGVKGIIKDNMIKRLTDESNHGEMLVSHALGYLVASRQGLAEDELVDLLSRDPEVYEWFFRQTYHLPSDLVNLAMDHLEKHPQEAADLHPESYHDQERLAIDWLRHERQAIDWLKQDRTPPEPVRKFLREVLQRADGPRLPIVLWSRLSFDLAPYLSERLVDGSALLSFYHRELGDVSKAEFLQEEDAPAYHGKLADYFRVKANPDKDRPWTGGNKHALSELPFHLTQAGERDAVFKLLTDFTFLEHKAEEVGITRTKDEFGREAVTSEGVQDLQKDYDLALETFYGGSGGGVGGGPLIRTAEEIGGVLRVYCPVCNKKSEITRDDLGTVIICPQEDCKAKLKLNTFTIKMD